MADLQLWETIFGGRKAKSPTWALHSETKDRLREVLQTLTPREEIVLRRRFGIDCAPETRCAVGKTLDNQFSKRFRGLTAVRVAQIEAKALRKLRHPNRARLLAAHAIKLGLDQNGYLASLLTTKEAQ